MTDGTHFLAVKPLSVKTTRASCADAVILNVMRHNARELQAEIGVGTDSGIDASRIHLNVTLHGPATADGVASAARDAMREHGIVAPRKNATLGIEIVASLPAGLVIDHLAYFRDTMAWAQQHYRVPLLSAIVHNDESCPHLHLVLLPVRDGKLVGSELLGNRATMKAMQKDFHEQVAKQYGLRMPAAKTRHSAAQRAAGIALLRDTLQANSGLTERAIDALLVPHAKNPEPLLVALGLAMPAPVVKGSFVATMTRKVRPDRTDSAYKKSPIGHLRAQEVVGFSAENEKSYALLGDCISPPNFPSPANPSNASNSASGQQASSSPAVQQSTTDQQRERSTTSIEQTTASQAGQVATAKMRKRTSKMAASTSPSPRTSAAGIAPTADQADTQTAKLALQQAGHQQEQQHRAHAIEEQAAPGGRPQTGNAGIEVTVDTPAMRTRTTGIVPANDTRAGQPAVSAAVPARQQAPSIEHVTPCNAKVSHAAPARRAKASTATPASAPAAPRAGKRSSTASWPAATLSTPSTSTRSTCSTAAPSTTPKPKRTAMLQQASGTLAQDTLPAKAAPAPATPTRRTAPSRKASSTPALGKGQYDASADQPDEIRRLGHEGMPTDWRARSPSCTAPPPKDALKLQPISPTPGSAGHSPEFWGQHHSPEYFVQLQVDQDARQHAGGNGRRGAPAPDLLPMPGPCMKSGAAARPAAQARIAEHARHQAPASVIEQGPLQGGARPGQQHRDGVSCLSTPHLFTLMGDQLKPALQGDLAAPGDDYQRQRDDEHAAECWDSERGEFVTLPRRPARTTAMPAGRCDWLDDGYMAGLWHEARPAAIDAALASVLALRGAG